jgi:hypothetical protein
MPATAEIHRLGQGASEREFEELLRRAAELMRLLSRASTLQEVGAMPVGRKADAA